MNRSRLEVSLADSSALNMVPAAREALSGITISPDRFVDQLPASAGLYSLHSDDSGLEALGMSKFRTTPLYVGKSERNLNSRDARDHFATGKTGWSTVRRSLASLLCMELELVVALRNETRPARPANYGLQPSGDARLSVWMADHLTLSYWLCPKGINLDHIETLVIDEWQPPLNLDKVRVRYKPLVVSREQMRLEAKRLVAN